MTDLRWESDAGSVWPCGVCILVVPESFAMPLRTESLEDPQLNLTPMIDVVFLLIIFFMVGARFTEEAQHQQFDVELPTASPLQPMSRQPDPLVVSVTQDGRIRLQNRELTPSELLSQLKSAKAAYESQAVLIRGDASVSYQGIMDVMNACHQAEIRRFSLAFQPLDLPRAPSP